MRTPAPGFVSCSPAEPIGDTVNGSAISSLASLRVLLGLDSPLLLRAAIDRSAAIRAAASLSTSVCSSWTVDRKAWAARLSPYRSPCASCRSERSSRSNCSSLARSVATDPSCCLSCSHLDLSAASAASLSRSNLSLSASMSLASCAAYFASRTVWRRPSARSSLCCRNSSSSRCTCSSYCNKDPLPVISVPPFSSSSEGVPAPEPEP